MDIQENLELIREKASEVAQAAVRKTKQLTEIAKTNLAIRSEEDTVKKAYYELGKLYYRDYVVGEERDEAEYLPLCQKIDRCKQTVADLQDYVDEIKMGQVSNDYEDVEDVDAEDISAETEE